MENMMNWLVEEEDGQGMVEYALIIALISIVAIGVLTTMGNNIKNMFQKASDNIK